MPKPQEVAELVVNGRRFSDWTSVMVRHEFGQAFHEFKFTCTEGQPGVRNWAEIRVKPGDSCEIYLAGELALTGYVNVRQVAFTAETHGIEIQGRSKTQDVADSSVKTKTGEFKNYPWEAIANKVLAPFGVGLEIVGAISAQPFAKASVQPGETAFEFIERLARTRGIVLGTNVRGNLVALADGLPGGDRLVEGDNMLEGREVISDEMAHSEYTFHGQANGSDDQWGPRITHQPKSTLTDPNVQRYRPFIGFAELPAMIPDLKQRAAMEGAFRNGANVWVEGVAQGWLRPTGGLWQAGQGIYVYSPMLIMDEGLFAKVVTFTQDDKTGTRTTIELVRKYGLAAIPDLSGNSTGPAP